MKTIKTINLWKDYKVLESKDIFSIYTDAGFSMNTRKACMARKIGDKEVEVMKDIEVPYIKGLKQYTNLMELKAVLWALENAPTKEKVYLFTDSKTIVSWVNRRKNNLGDFSSFHKETKDRIDKIKKSLKGFHISWVSRESNLAGKALESKHKSINKN